MFRRLVINLLLRHKRYKFKQWIELEDRKIRILKASGQDKDKFPQLVLEFLPDALPIPQWVWARMPWEDTLATFYRICHILPVRSYLPIISLTDDAKEEPIPIPWTYPGRVWHYYSHLLAHAYGWSLEYIAQLDVFEAMAKIEEILLDKQLDREFEWSMSEASVIYDAKNKTSRPNPLPRPYWMKQLNPDDPAPVKKVRMPKGFLPVGNVNNEAIPEELRPKEINSH